MTLRNLATVSLDDRTAEARTHYTEALQIRRDLAKANPAALPDVASTLTELAMLSSDEKRPAEARLHHGEALRIYRELARKAPAQYMIEVAPTLRAMGLESRMNNRHAEARAEYEEALAVYRSLAQQSPGTLDVYLRAVEAGLERLAGAR